jgi:hypothetical protein
VPGRIPALADPEVAVMETAPRTVPTTVPTPLVDVDDLHAADAELLLADALELVGPAALVAHALTRSATDLLT